MKTRNLLLRVSRKIGAFLLICTSAYLPICTSAQNVGISATGATPDNSAMLDVVSNNKGMLIPRMTGAEKYAITTPATGLLIFQTDTVGFWYYEGSKWIPLLSSTSSTSSPTNAAWLTTGNSGTNGSNFLGTSDNVSLRMKANDTTRVIVDSLGRVGIGTTSPNAPLEISGTSARQIITATTGNPAIELRANSATGISYIDFTKSSTGWNTPDYGGRFSWTEAGTDAFAISGGNVGIGTTSPTEKLHINGALVTQSGQVKRDFATFYTINCSPDPIHIKTNINWNNIMYRIVVEGYNYRASLSIYSEVGGYTWTGAPAVITNGFAKNYATGANISQYKSADGFVVVKLTPATDCFYYVGFSVSAWLTNPAGNAFNISATIVQQAADL